jgi:3-oxoacyl-[acyl-carrier protein] reductase
MGRVIASRLAADGFDVAVAYVGNSGLADTAVKEIEPHGRRGTAFAADVADEEAVSALFNAVEDHFQHPDVVVHTAEINRSAYPASKAAVDVLTRILAKELRGRDITVNAVAPGPTATEAFPDSTPAEEQKQSAAAPPPDRLGSPDDIADVVSFLVGPTGRWINGQVVYANGDLSNRPPGTTDPERERHVPQR